jgi:DNA-binding GntR family transcriptional regulator
MRKAVGENNLDLVTHLNTQFHRLITESTKNSYLIEIRGNSRRLLDRVGQVNAIVPGQNEATLQEHQRMIDAFKARNAALAEYVCKEHLESARKRLLEYLVSDNKQTALLNENPKKKRKRN